MNLKIYGDLHYFWQWDLDRKLVVDDGGACSQVHFCNGTGEALVCKVREEGDIRVVDVPNILLQKDEPIKAYLYTTAEDGARTRSAFRFSVLARTKPEAYVYTETEVLSYTSLDKRLKDLEGDGLANAVADYLAENPVEAGATAEEAEQIQQNKKDIEKLTADKLDAEKLPEAINDALAQAKASGAFDGAPGQPGDDYVLTEADKQEIAEQAAGMVEVPEVPSVEIPTNLPNPHALTFTGAVSATYDGSEAVSVDIPLGGGGGSSGVEFSQIANVVTTEDVNMITVDIPSGVTEVVVFAEGLATVANKYSFLKANNTIIGNAGKVSESSNWFYDNNIRCMITHLTHLTENSWSYSFNNNALINGQSTNCVVGYTEAIKNGLNTLTLCSADAQYKAGFKFFVWGR